MHSYDRAMATTLLASAPPNFFTCQVRDVVRPNLQRDAYLLLIESEVVVRACHALLSVVQIASKTSLNAILIPEPVLLRLSAGPS